MQREYDPEKTIEIKKQSGLSQLNTSNTVQCEYDPEKMIEEIKKRPGLWDFGDPGYRSKETRRKLWQEVVQELLVNESSDVISCTKSELRELEIQIQKKWKGIRDCFHKHLFKPNYTKRPYVYSKRLQFLKKALKSRAQESSPQSTFWSSNDGAESESDDGQKNKWKIKSRLKLFKKEESEEDDDNDGDNFQETPIYYEYNDDGYPTQPAKVAKTSRATEEFAFASVENTDDCDRMFLLSLLPHLKAIPEENRMDAKIELMQIIRNAKRKSNSIFRND